MTGHLNCYIGLDERGKMKVFVSSINLNELSTMHMRGRPFPSYAMEFMEKQEGEPLEVLNAMKRYYEQKERKQK